MNCEGFSCPGNRPPVDEVWNQYLVASPEVGDKFKKQFGRQIEYKMDGNEGAIVVIAEEMSVEPLRIEDGKVA